MTERSNSDQLVTGPIFRFNGSTIAPPWNTPEIELVAGLQAQPIDMLTSDIFNVEAGRFGCELDINGVRYPAMVKFAGIARDLEVDTWAAEYCIEDNAELISREIASYEAVKALGGEDIGIPIAMREFDTVALLDNGIRLQLAKAYRVTLKSVDDKLGVSASVQLVPRNSVSFAEHWGQLGATNAERWVAASDQLRYSLYRCYVIDFIIGTAHRTLFSIPYNMNTDRVHMTDLSMTFPHAGFSAEKYMQMRYRGWGRSDILQTLDGQPPSTYDFHSLFRDLQPQFVAEAVMTAKQISERMTDEMAARLTMVLIEHDVPVECVASMLYRLAYLSFSPGSVIKRPVEFIRNICVPVRADMDVSDPRISSAIEYVNGIMSSVLLEEFDMLNVLVHKTPDGVEFLI